MPVEGDLDIRVGGIRLFTTGLRDVSGRYQSYRKNLQGDRVLAARYKMVRGEMEILKDRLARTFAQRFPHADRDENVANDKTHELPSMHGQWALDDVTAAHAADSADTAQAWELFNKKTVSSYSGYVYSLLAILDQGKRGSVIAPVEAARLRFPNRKGYDLPTMPDGYVATQTPIVQQPIAGAHLVAQEFARSAQRIKERVNLDSGRTIVEIIEKLKG